MLLLRLLAIQSQTHVIRTHPVEGELDCKHRDVVKTLGQECFLGWLKLFQRNPQRKLTKESGMTITRT